VTDSTRGGRPLTEEPLSRRLPLRNRLDEPTGTLGSGSDFGTENDDDWLSAPRPASSAFEPASAGAADRPLDPFSTMDPLTTPPEPERQRRARMSVPVFFGLVCSLTGALAALTAVLAPVAFVLGGLGVVLSVLGLFTAHKPHVSGRFIAVIALILGLGTVALAGIEHVGTITWLAGDNQPMRLRHWLNAKLPFLH
jgi:hypothetical protein